MRIIHTIHGPRATATATLVLYAHKLDSVQAHGGRVEVLIVSPVQPLRLEEVIEIEGDICDVRRVLAEAVAVIDDLARGEVEAGRLTPAWAKRGERVVEVERKKGS